MACRDWPLAWGLQAVAHRPFRVFSRAEVSLRSRAWGQHGRRRWDIVPWGTFGTAFSGLLTVALTGIGHQLCCQDWRRLGEEVDTVLCLAQGCEHQWCWMRVVAQGLAHISFLSDGLC